MTAPTPDWCPHCGSQNWDWWYPGYYRCGECGAEGGHLFTAATSVRLAAMSAPSAVIWGERQ